MVLVNSHEMAAINDKLDKVMGVVEELKKERGVLSERWLTNPEVCDLLKISGRLLQSWRDNGELSFSQHGSKIYYRVTDVEKFLMNNFKEAFNNKVK